MSPIPPRLRPLLLTDPLDVRSREGSAPRRRLVLSAPLPAAAPQPHRPRFSFLPRSEGWREILLEDSFVFRPLDGPPAPAPAEAALPPDVLALSFLRKAPPKGS